MPAGHPLNPNKAATRFRGPMVFGAPSILGEGASNGASTEPLISFWNAPEFGYFVGSSSTVSFATPAGALVAYTSGAMRVGTTAPYTAATLDTLTHFVIPCSTVTLSSGDLPPSAALQGGAALVFQVSSDGVGGRLWAYSTYSTGWMTSTDVWKTTTT